MSQYSKQYVENYMPEWKWDFDLDEEFGKLEPGEFTPLICEGYGFVGIQKQLDGSQYFLYRDNSQKIIEVPYQFANDIENSFIIGEN